jgi:hypothetical protein
VVSVDLRKALQQLWKGFGFLLAQRSLVVAFFAGPAAVAPEGAASDGEAPDGEAPAEGAAPEGAISDGAICDDGAGDLEGEVAELCACAALPAPSANAAIKSTFFTSKRGIKFCFTEWLKLMQDSFHKVVGKPIATQ